MKQNLGDEFTDLRSPLSVLGIFLLLSNDWDMEAGRRAERGTWSNDLKKSRKDYTNNDTVTEVTHRQFLK